MSEEAVEVIEEKKPKKRGRKPKAQENLITGAVNAEEFSKSAYDIQNEFLVSADDVIEILTKSMEKAYLEWSYPGLFKDKDNPDPDKDLIKCEIVFNDDNSSFKIYDVKTVRLDDDITDDAREISLEDAQEIVPDCQIGDIIRIPFDSTQLDKSYVRRVKQLFQSNIKEASRQAILAKYAANIGGLIEGTVVKADPVGRNYEVSFGQASGFLHAKNIIPGESFEKGQRISVYLNNISEKSNPPSLSISRSNEKFVVKLMEEWIPELRTGEVVIKAISREAGKRTKVFVDSTNPNLDPVGACLGAESNRIRTVINEIRGEKIDILRYHTNKALQIVEAMKPASVVGLSCPDDFFDADVHYDELETESGYQFPAVVAVVQNGNQGVAIGSAGVNVRLAGLVTKTTISVQQADDAISNRLNYITLPEIERLAALCAVSSEPEVQEAQEEPEPSSYHEEEEIEEAVDFSDHSEPANEPAPAANAAEEEKPAEPVSKTSELKEQPVEHIEITNRPKISLQELEEAIGPKKGPSETKSSKRNDRKEEKKEEKPSVPAAPIEAMPIYTQEELDALDAAEEEEEDLYDDDDAYDYYDEYEDDRN